MSNNFTTISPTICLTKDEIETICIGLQAAQADVREARDKLDAEYTILMSHVTQRFNAHAASIINKLVDYRKRVDQAIKTKHSEEDEDIHY